MRKKYKTLFNFILIGSLIVNFSGSHAWWSMTVEATTAEEIQDQINQHSYDLETIYSKIADLESEQDLMQEEIDDLNAEILNTMTSIEMKEDEIAEKENEIFLKETEITEKEDEIVQKQFQIEQTEAEYELSVQREEDQRVNMAVCARLIYERGEDSFLDALLEGKGLADILNQMDRVERVYEYENAVLLEYINVKEQVQALWDRLEVEKTELEADMQQLEADRELLVADREQLVADSQELQDQKTSLNAMLARKKQESANYEAEIKQAQREAAAAKALLQQEQQKLKQLQAAQNGSGTTNAASGTYTTSYSAVINNASGSELGKTIANYACQYIGNPYVLGGTSLTSGADCSGFTYRIYSDFGYSIPRTSLQQRTAGTAVNYSDAQPGDLICYDGHVALYIGGGLIVHASNSNPYPSGGIKVGQAQYRTILAVRRIVK